MRAARLLDDAVGKYLRESLPYIKHTRVIVRVYADVTNLSKQLGKSKLVGQEKRSLCAFTAGFTRVIAHSDYSDALDEEGTNFKIRGEASMLDVNESRLIYSSFFLFF